MTLYIQLIGSLMYLVNTRLDTFYALSGLSHFMSQSRETHCIVLNRSHSSMTKLS
jgi:hypothetical protein